jgi:hypothetical protein
MIPYLLTTDQRNERVKFKAIDTHQERYVRFLFNTQGIVDQIPDSRGRSVTSKY